MRVLFLVIFIINYIFATTYKVSYNSNYAPFSFNENNKAEGILVDIWRLWAKESGNKVIFIEAKNYNDAINLVKNKKVDFFIGTHQLEKWMKSGVKIYEAKAGFFGLKNNNSFSKIGIIGNNYKKYVLSKYKNAKIFSFKTYKDLINALINKKIDVGFDDILAIKYYLIKHHKNHLFRFYQNYFKMGIYPISYDEDKIKIFNKYFSKIPPNKLSDIEDLWIINPNDKYYKSSIFTQKELDFIKQQKLIKIALFNYWKDNIHKELLKDITTLSGLNIQPIYFDSWKEGFEEAKKGDIQGIMNLSYSKERTKYFYYTIPYKFTPAYLIAKNKKNITQYKHIAVVKNNILAQYLKDLNLSQKIVFVNNLDELYSFANKHNNSAICTFFKKDNLIKKYNLQIIKKIYTSYGDVYIGINKKYPLIYSIINKTMKQIDLNKYRFTSQSKKETKSINPFSYLSYEHIIFLILISTIIAFVTYFLFVKKGLSNISIKTFAISIMIFEFIIGGYLIFEVIKYNSLSTYLSQLKAEHLKARILADELRQSSDDLTNFARAYAVTGDEKFKNQYFEVLGIRNGTIRKPINYENIYWDLNEKIRNKLHPRGDYVRFNDLVKNSPLTDEEKHLIYLSHKNSDDLVNLEKRAFKLVKEGNLILATHLLYSPEYYKAKEKIMLPIDKLFFKVHNRISSEIVETKKKMSIYFTFILFISFIFIAGNVFIFFLIRKKIINPIDYLRNLIYKLKSNQKVDKIEKFYNDEIGLAINEFFEFHKQIEAKQKALILANKEIQDSINYASLIQKSILNDEALKLKTKDYFILYKPKDIIGGDIYFAEIIDDGLLVMCFDCIGHGVYGALVTIFIEMIKNEILNEINQISPAKILKLFDIKIKALKLAFSKNGLIGFDGSIVYIKDNKLQFAGAKSDMFYIEKGEVKTLKGDRYSIGISNKEIKIENKTITISNDFQFYLTTDGFIDQQGGEKGFGFGKKRFKSLIKEIYQYDMNKQKELFIEKFVEYKGNFEQVDDLLVIGIKI